MKKIGIIGSGLMGTDIAHAFAQDGYSAIVVDVNPQQFDKAKEKIRQNLRFQKLYKNAERSVDYKSVLANIEFTTDLNRMKGLDYIIETVTEEWDIKRKVHSQLETITADNTVVAVNTSAISITRVGSLKRKPENVVGIHFMNPAYLMPTVEIIRGFHTCDFAIDRTKTLLGTIGKKSIVVQDSPGFVTNRPMMIFINEAICCLHEKIAPKEDIDLLFKECFGHKMGPLQTADLIGLDTVLRSLEVLYQSFNDDKYRPCILLKQMVDAGFHGMKNGRGFYEYCK